jgi:hypothetical protein
MSFQIQVAPINGSCRVAVTRVGAKGTLTITDLHPSTTYYYTARDNVSGKLGPRSAVANARRR